MHAYICQQLLSWWYPDQQYTIMDFIVSRYVVIWAHILPRDINQRLSDIDQAYVCMRLISLDMGPYRITINWPYNEVQSQHSCGCQEICLAKKGEELYIYEVKINCNPLTYLMHQLWVQATSTSIIITIMTLFSTLSSVLKNSVHWIKLRCSCRCCCTASCDVICLLMTHKVNRQ